MIASPRVGAGLRTPCWHRVPCTGIARRRIDAIQGSIRVQGAGKDTIQGYFDLAQLLSSSGGAKGPYEDLAYKIGNDIYIDVQGWHLYLKDAKAGKGKVAEALANQLGIDMSQGKLSPDQLEGVLKKVPISLGGGKTTVSLLDVLPSVCLQDLKRILEKWESK